MVFSLTRSGLPATVASPGSSDSLTWSLNAHVWELFHVHLPRCVVHLHGSWDDGGLDNTLGTELNLQVDIEIWYCFKFNLKSLRMAVS